MVVEYSNFIEFFLFIIFKLAQRTKSRPIFPKIVKTEATNVFTSKVPKSSQIFGPLLYENL